MLVDRFDTRRNSPSLRKIASRCAASRGAISRLNRLQRVVGVRCRRWRRTLRSTRVSRSPERSSATIVFSNVGSRRLVGDRIDLGEMPPHAFLDRRLVVLVANAVERRRAERQRARREERVVAIERRPISPGSKGRKLRSHATTAFAKTEKSRTACTTARTIPPTTSIELHGGFGADAIIQTIGMPIASSSPRDEIEHVGADPEVRDSPRSSARPHVGQWSCILNQMRRMPPPPQRGHRNTNARRNFVATVDVEPRS